MARLVGILVKRDMTSNETSTSSSSSVCVVVNLAKSVELRTWCSELPTRGDKMLTRCFKSEYIGDDMKDTMGLSGTSWEGHTAGGGGQLNHGACGIGSLIGGLTYGERGGGSSSSVGG